MKDLLDDYSETDRDMLDLRSTSKRKGGSSTKMEDYALKRVPSIWKWSWKQIMMVVWGGVTFLYAFELGGLISTEWGVPALIFSFIVCLIWTIYPTLWFMHKGSLEGLGAAILSRSTYGYKGAGIIAILYVFLWLYYFAAEGGIMASSAATYISQIPYSIWVLIIVLIFIPLTLYGMSFLAKFQLATWFIWLPLVVAMVVLAFLGRGLFGTVADYNPVVLHHLFTFTPKGEPLFSVTTFLLAAAAGMGLFMLWPLWGIDYGRFLKKEERKTGGVWKFWAPYAIVPLIDFLLGGLIAPIYNQPDPGVYAVYLLGGFGLLLAIITQLRINVENVYSGSLSTSNFFAAIFNFMPGRRIWMIAFLIFALIFMELDVLNYAIYISDFLVIFLGSWISVMLVDYKIVRKRYHLPMYSEYRRGYLKDFNKANFPALIIPIIVNVPALLGYYGGTIYDSISWLLAIIEATVISLALNSYAYSKEGEQGVKSNYYARIPKDIKNTEEAKLIGIVHAKYNDSLENMKEVK